MKTLILDESKWRCGLGGNSNTARGKGVTLLLNTLGESCCLGQFAPQLNKKVIGHLRGISQPSQIGLRVPLLNITRERKRKNTVLTNKAIRINDNKNTTIKEKVSLLRKLFRPKGYRIVFRRTHQQNKSINDAIAKISFPQCTC